MRQITNTFKNFSQKFKYYYFSVLPSFFKEKIENKFGWIISQTTQIQKRFDDSLYGRAFSNSVFNLWIEVRYFYSKGAKKEFSILWSQVILFQDVRHLVISFGTLFFISFRTFGCKNWFLTEKNTSLPATITTFQSLPYKKFIEEDIYPYTSEKIPESSKNKLVDISNLSVSKSSLNKNLLAVPHYPKLTSSVPLVRYPEKTAFLNKTNRQKGTNFVSKEEQKYQTKNLKLSFPFSKQEKTATRFGQRFEFIGNKAFIQKRFTPTSVWYHGTKIVPRKYKINKKQLIPNGQKLVFKTNWAWNRGENKASFSVNSFVGPVAAIKSQNSEMLANGFSFWSGKVPGKASNKSAWLKNWYGESINYPKLIQNWEPFSENKTKAFGSEVKNELEQSSFFVNKVEESFWPLFTSLPLEKVDLGFQERPQGNFYTYPYLKPEEIAFLRLQRFYQAIAAGWKPFLFNASGWKGTPFSKRFLRLEKIVGSNSNPLFTFAGTFSKGVKGLKQSPWMERTRPTSVLSKEKQRFLASEFTENSLLGTRSSESKNGPPFSLCYRQRSSRLYSPVRGVGREDLLNNSRKGLNNIWHEEMLESTSSVVVNFVSNFNGLPSFLKPRPVPKISPESKFDFIFHYNFVWPVKPTNKTVPSPFRARFGKMVPDRSSLSYPYFVTLSQLPLNKNLKKFSQQRLLNKPIRQPEIAYVFDSFGPKTTLDGISPSRSTGEVKNGLGVEEWKNLVFSGPFLGQKRHYAGLNFNNVDPTLGSRKINLRKKQGGFFSEQASFSEVVENQKLLIKSGIKDKQQLNVVDSNPIIKGIKEFGKLVSTKHFFKKGATAVLKPTPTEFENSVLAQQHNFKVKPVSFFRREKEITAKKIGSGAEGLYYGAHVKNGFPGNEAIEIAKQLPVSKQGALFTRKDFQNQWKKPKIKAIEKAKTSLSVSPNNYSSAQFAFIADSNDVFGSFSKKRRKKGKKFKPGQSKVICRRSQDTKGVTRLNRPSNILPSISTTRQLFIKDWKQKQLDQISRLLDNDAKQIKQYLLEKQPATIFDKDKNLVKVLPKVFSKKLQSRLETTTSFQESIRLMQPAGTAQSSKDSFLAPSSRELGPISEQGSGIKKEQDFQTKPVRGSDPKRGILARFRRATIPKIKVSLVNDHKKIEWPRSYIDYDSFYSYLASIYSVQSPSIESKVSAKQSIYPFSQGRIKYNFIPWTQNYDDQEAVLSKSKLPIQYKTKRPFYDFETRTPFQKVIRLMHTVPQNSQNSISTLWWHFRKNKTWSQLGLWQNLGSELSYTKYKMNSSVVSTKILESAPLLKFIWLSFSGIAFLCFLGVVLNKIYSNYGDEILEFVKTVDVETRATALPQLLPEELPYNEFEKIDDLLLRDVMGLDSSLFILGDIAWFYRNGCRSHTASVTVPKAVLLTGPPGIGKTYLSRALAGEAGVPIITQSGGNIKDTKDREEDGSLSPKAPADVITQLFAKARQMAPCLVFVDEIDAIAQSRNNLFYDVTVDYKHFMHGVRMDKITHLNTPDKEFKRKLAHVAPTSLLDQQRPMFLEQPSPILPKERDLERWEPNPLDRLVSRESEFLAKDYRRNVRIQGRWDYIGKKKNLDYSMLVEFLIQLDNLQVDDGIVVLGATNRFFALDAAFLRPGRFGSLVNIELPGKLQRIQLLQKLAFGSEATSQKEPWRIDGIFSSSFVKKNLGVQPDLSWDYIGNLSRGLSGAEIAAVINQSVLESVLLKTENHTTETFEKAIETLLSRDQAEDTFADQKPSNQQASPFQSVDPKQLQLTNQLLVNELPKDGLTYIMDSATIAQQSFYQAAKATLYTLLLDHPPAIYLPLWPRKLNQRHAARTGFQIPEYSSGIFYSKRELEIYLIGLYAGKAGQVMAGLSYFGTSTSNKGHLTALWSQSSLAKEDLEAAQQLVLYMVDETFLYSQQVASLQCNPLEGTQFNFLNFNSTHILRNTMTTEQIMKDIVTPAKMVKTSFMHKVNLSKASKFALLEMDALELTGNEDPIWNAFWIKDKRALELNPEWIRPDRFFHSQPNTKSLESTVAPGRKTSNGCFTNKTSYNNQYHDVRARLFHVLSLKTFNTAVLILDRNREILDYFAAHLLRHSVLRQGDIRAIFEQFGYPLKPAQFGYTLQSEM